MLPETISASTSAEIRGPHDLALADRDATLDLGEIFAKADADDQLFDLRQQPALLHAPGISGELAHRFDIGRKPGEPVRRALFAVEQTRRLPPLQHHPLAHLGGGIRQQRLDGRGRGTRQGQEAAACGVRTKSGLRHGI